MNKTHEIKLNPTKSQRVFFAKSCGVARFAYNWALNSWNKKYEAKEKTSAYSLIKELTSIKKTEYSWMLEVGKTCPQYAIHNVESAFKGYFRRLKDGTIEANKKQYFKSRKTKGLPIEEKKLQSIGKPNFKKKGIHDSFVAIENESSFKQEKNKIWIPRLGWVKCAENLRFKGKINNVIVKKIANMWFAVINIVSDEAPIICKNQAIVGVDLGIKSLAVTSGGKVYENPKALKSNLRKLRIRQKSLSRKVKGSNNRKKAQMKVAKTYYRVSCIRKNALHQATTNIVNNYGIIVLEDLNVKGMTKNHHLAQAVNDVSFGEFKRQIKYKAKWQGKQVIVADRWFASSKICSCCGNVQDMPLSKREYKCEKCGLIIDRDLNASINLANYGSTLRHKESQVCGVRSSSVVIPNSPTMKQKIVCNFNIN